ncbi:MAG: HNH endonuclease signature motif containing protein [Bryobacteraceae bacterium]
MNRDLVREVRQRAQDRCEYCHLSVYVYPLPFHVDHIIARQHGGQTVLENLALACLHCNRHKGPNIAGTDPDTGEIIRLFHPRVDLWSEHFEWTGAALGGRTEVGRVTIHLLAINDSDFLAMREALIQEQTFPIE